MVTRRSAPSSTALHARDALHCGLERRERMRKRNVITALAAAAMMLPLTGVTGPALAQAALEFEYTPLEGLAGTRIDFEGSGCPHDPNPTSDGLFMLTRTGITGEPAYFESESDGTFSGEYDTTGLSPGTYTVVMSCLTNEAFGIGEEPFTVNEPPPPPAPVGSRYFPVSPGRVLDTRDGTGTGGVVDPIGPDEVLDLKVTNVAGVPATGVTAIALNVTATNASADSHLKVWPAGSPQPDASNLNFTPGISIPNLVIARVGTDGKVSLRNNAGAVDVVADVQGWFSNAGTGGSRYAPVNPQRILDTREGLGGAAAQVGPFSSIEVAVTGVAGVPADATAVVLNMTVDQATGPESYLSVWPAGATPPTASNLNFTGGPATTNLVIARVGEGGKVVVYNHLGSTDVIADVQGWFAAPAATTGSSYFPTNPARILDSRNGVGTPGGAKGQLGTDSTIDVPVTDVGGVPGSGVTAVVLNVTVADSPPGAPSYITLFPAGTARPVTSNLVYSPGEIVPNLVIVRVNDGKVSMYNFVNQTSVIADVQGWFSSE